MLSQYPRDADVIIIFILSIQQIFFLMSKKAMAKVILIHVFCMEQSRRKEGKSAKNYIQSHECHNTPKVAQGACV